MSKHDWTIHDVMDVRGRSPYTTAQIHLNESGTEFADVYHSDHDELVRIVRLMVAAPKMLEALKDSLSWLSSYPGGLAEKQYARVRAAIAEAGGEA